MSLILFRNGRMLALVIAFLLVAGVAAITTLPRTEDPRVTNRLGLVLRSQVPASWATERWTCCQYHVL